jgi:hypothetical protein
MATTKSRLLEFLAYLSIGQNAFEKKVGISNGYINNVKNSIGSDIINKISSAYPELNTEWLVGGNGEMIKTVVNQNNVEGDNIHGHTVTVNKSQTDKFLDLLKTKDEQICKSQEQIDRLIGIIEKLNIINNE